MTVKERLICFIKSLNIGQSAFEKEVGLSNGYVNNIRQSVQPDKLQKIALKFPALNTGWLMTGEGKMLKNNPIQEEKNVPLGKEIYLYDVSASAGFGTFDEMITKEKVIGKYVVPDFRNVDWMIYIKGSSMYPKYSSGDIIACRELHESQFIQWGKVYVLATREQGILVKRLEKSENDDFLTAVSDNPAYKPFDVPKNEIVGIALVVGVIRME